MSFTEDAHKPLILTEEHQSPSQVKLFNGQVILNPKISKINFVAFLLYSFYVGTILLPLNALQEPLLTHIYNLTAPQAADANSLFQLTQIGGQILLAPLFGYFCDKYGRKLFIIIGVITLTISIALLPNLPDLYPYFYFIQLLQGVGVLAIGISPFLADYIDSKTKGRVAGLVTVCNFLGAATATLINQFADLNNNLRQQYYKLGALDLVIGITLIIGLKGGQYYKNSSSDQGAVEVKKVNHEKTNFESDSPLDKERRKPYETSHDSRVVINDDASNTNINQNLRTDNNQTQKEEGMSLKDGLKAAQNPWILAGYISYFLGLEFINLMGYPMVTYVKGLIANDEQATNQASALATVGLAVGVLSSFFTGVLADKFNKFKILVFAVLNSFIGIILISVLKNPFNFATYLAMVSVGMSAGTFITLATQFLGKYADPKYRASVSSIGAMCALIGGVITNILGVYLSKYNFLYPFFIYAGFAFIGLTLLIILYAYKKNILNTL